MINTKSAPRRELKFDTIDELCADLDRIDAAYATGGLGHTGNWTPEQILDHLANFWGCSFDGFPGGNLPLLLRVMVQMLYKKKATSGHQPPPGYKIPKQAPHFLPRQGVTYQQGMQALRTCVERVKQGDAYVPESPLFGKLTRDEWTRIHLGHCGMHLSFISIGQ